MYSMVIVAEFCTVDNWDPVKDPENAAAGATRAREITVEVFIVDVLYCCYRILFSCVNKDS